MLRDYCGSSLQCIRYRSTEHQIQVPNDNIPVDLLHANVSVLTTSSVLVSMLVGVDLLHDARHRPLLLVQFLVPLKYGSTNHAAASHQWYRHLISSFAIIWTDGAKLRSSTISHESLHFGSICSSSWAVNVGDWNFIFPFKLIVHLLRKSSRWQPPGRMSSMMPKLDDQSVWGWWRSRIFKYPMVASTHSHVRQSVWRAINYQPYPRWYHSHGLPRLLRRTLGRNSRLAGKYGAAWRHPTSPTITTNCAGNVIRIHQ
jgi:hypothetical protein